MTEPGQVLDYLDQMDSRLAELLRLEEPVQHLLLMHEIWMLFLVGFGGQSSFR